MNTPAGIATIQDVPGSGVWVADTRNNRIVQFSVAGRFLKSIDCAACPLGRFLGPVGIALHKVKGGYRIFVSEELAGRVRVLTPEGNQIGSIGFRGVGEGRLGYPDDVAVDADGTLFVAEAGNANRRISLFEPDGSFIRKLSKIPDLLEDPLVSPHAVAVGPGGQLLIVDTASHRVFLSRIERPAIKIVTGFLSLDTRPPYASLFIEFNDMDRQCDVTGGATFAAKRGADQVTFRKAFKHDRVSSKGALLEFKLTATQTALMKAADDANVDMKFTGICDGRKVVSAGKFWFSKPE